MLTQDRLKELLAYCQDTGSFVWRSGSRGSVLGYKNAGCVTSNGYLTIWVDNKRYAAHRLAFMYITGEWPSGEVDHINHIKSDNRWANLRDATRPENQFNATIRSDNKSGRKGVRWHKQANKWNPLIKINGKQKSLGLYDDLDKAAEAYAKASKIVHGEFSYLGE